MWQDFTGVYSLSKTLRFELKPTETTKRYLEKSGVKEQDKKRHESYKTAKKAIDVLHRKFLEESLAAVDISVNDLGQLGELVSSKDAKKKDIDAIVKRIYKAFDAAYTSTNKNWQTEMGLKKDFTSTPEAQLSALRAKKDEVAKSLKMDISELEDIIKQFDKFASYFDDYKTNRLNIYALENKATSAANRAINQNFAKFIKNRQKYEKFYAGKNILPDDCAELFDVAKYGSYLSQSEIERYNQKLGDLHKTINESRQNLSKKEKRDLPFFEPLFKQILGDGTKQVLFEQIEKPEDFVDLMQKLQQNMSTWLGKIEQHYKTYLRESANTDQVYINSRAVNAIIYSQTNNAPAVRSHFPESFGKKANSNDESQIATANFLSLRDFSQAVNDAQSELLESLVPGHKSKPDNAAAVVWNSFCDDLSSKIHEANKAVAAFCKLEEFGNGSKDQIKLALDSFNEVYKMYTYFELRYKNEPVVAIDADQEFYEIFNNGETPFPADKAERFSTAYDLARNWLTKKPYSLDKWKLNFDCSVLLSGWDVNKEPEKHGAIIKSPDDDLYLIVLNESGKNALNKEKHATVFSSPDGWQKMEYKLLPGPNKMLPKCLFSKKYRAENEIPNDVDEIYENGSFKKGDSFKTAHLHRLIDFYKEAIKTYPGWSMYDFHFRPTSEYESIDQFYFEVELGGYKLDFTPISFAEIKKLEDDEKLSLFKITNKDLSAKTGKIANMHTLYFMQAFEPDSGIKLNGEAEIFFRPKSIKAETSKDRRTPQGSEVITNKRFTEDKISLHIPISLNRKAKSIGNYAFNQHAMERIKTNGVDAVIGIDRGEKHLAYVAVVDKNGKLIKELISLNTITTYDKNKKAHKKDYFEELAQCEKDRQDNRKNWDAVRKIKDLKDGYVGHCVKKVVDLMVEHNAVVTLENLNVGFKQGRSAIERSTYNQFEQALLKKLQYVVDKTKQSQEVFGSQNGVQLTPPDVSPGKVSNHMGFVFYVDPSYTSAVDPVSGYRQHLRIDERVKAGNFSHFITQAFSSIGFEKDDLVFKFSWRQLATALNSLGKSKVKQKPSEYPSREWQITANVPRTIYSKNANNQSESKTINIQDSLKELFGKYSINMSGDIKKQLAEAKLDAKFVSSFVWHFSQINKLRNTIDGDDTIISPVYPDGFDSRHDKLDGYAWNGDANGAYNIARKGAILLDKLYEAKDPKEFQCKVTRQEYDEFLTTK